MPRPLPPQWLAVHAWNAGSKLRGAGQAVQLMQMAVQLLEACAPAGSEQLGWMKAALALAAATPGNVAFQQGGRQQEASQEPAAGAAAAEQPCSPKQLLGERPPAVPAALPDPPAAGTSSDASLPAADLPAGALAPQITLAEAEAPAAAAAPAMHQPTGTAAATAAAAAMPGAGHSLASAAAAALESAEHDSLSEDETDGEGGCGGWLGAVMNAQKRAKLAAGGGSAGKPAKRLGVPGLQRGNAPAATQAAVPRTKAAMPARPAAAAWDEWGPEALSLDSDMPAGGPGAFMGL